MRPAVGEGVGDAVGDAVGDSVCVVVVGDGVGVTVVIGAHALATSRATMNSLTELP